MTNTLSFELSKTAEWRREKAKLHPEDFRNAAAVAILVRLAQQSAGDVISARYDDMNNDEKISYERVSDAHSEILREIGFPWEPKHVDEVLERIVERATGRAPTCADLEKVIQSRVAAR